MKELRVDAVLTQRSDVTYGGLLIDEHPYQMAIRHHDRGDLVQATYWFWFNDMLYDCRNRAGGDPATDDVASLLVETYAFTSQG